MDAITSLALFIVSGDVHNKIPVTQCSVLILLHGITTPKGEKNQFTEIKAVLKHN
jgi:hypothetical protein